MKQIELTQGQVALVDDEDYEWLSQWLWFFHRHPVGGYAERRDGRKLLGMHVAIARRIGLIGRVDHENRDKLDNRRVNLRLATTSQNGANRKVQRNNTSGFRGVTLHKQNGWQAKIQIRGKTRHLGYFGNDEEAKRNAARAYNREAVKEFGEFAQLNEV